jgi:hypothetical protein
VPHVGDDGAQSITVIASFIWPDGSKAATYASSSGGAAIAAPGLR